MAKPNDASNDVKKEEKKVLAKIEPVKIETANPNVDLLDNAEASVDNSIELEKSIISATILLLREYGIRKSGAAVRDAVDISHQYIGPKEAVSSLSIGL